MDGFSFGQPPCFGTSGDFIMTKFVRLAALAAATTLAATPALAVDPDQKATATAKVVKPLTLEWNRNLDFGTIIVGALAGTDTVILSQAGTVICGSSGNLTCSGTPTSAQYTVTGSKQVDVRVNTTNSDLTNLTSGGSEKIQFRPTADFTMQLTNNGVPGTPFFLGGAIDITPTTVEGVYEGEVEVTVDYL